MHLIAIGIVRMHFLQESALANNKNCQYSANFYTKIHFLKACKNLSSLIKHPSKFCKTKVVKTHKEKANFEDNYSSTKLSSEENLKKSYSDMEVDDLFDYESCLNNYIIFK